MKRALLILAFAIALCGCTSADRARARGEKDTFTVQLVTSDRSHPLGGVSVKVVGFYPSLIMPKQRALAEARTDEHGSASFTVAPHFYYTIDVGGMLTAVGWRGCTSLTRTAMPSNRVIRVPVIWNANDLSPEEAMEDLLQTSASADQKPNTPATK
jgi:hypothetical protein